MWGLASLKCVGQASNLETQTGVDVVILSLKPVGQAGRLETQAGFLCYSIKIALLLLWGTSGFAVKAFN